MFAAACAAPTALAKKAEPKAEQTASPEGMKTLDGTIEVQTDDRWGRRVYMALNSGRHVGEQRELAFVDGPPKPLLLTGALVRVYLDPTTALAADPLPVRYIEVLQLPRSATAMYPMRTQTGSSSGGGLAGEPEVLGNGTASGINATLPGGSTNSSSSNNSSNGNGSAGGNSGVAPVRFSSVTVLLSVCGQKPNVTAEDFRKQWYHSGSDDLPSALAAIRSGSGLNVSAAAAPPSMERFFETCSYGKVRFRPEDNVVLGPVDVPCTGVSPTSGVPYNASQCKPDDLYGWAAVAEQAVVAALGQAAAERLRHRLLILPQMPACDWKGLAEVGCGDRCYAWIRGGSARTLSTIFHELSHNLGAEHATVLGSGADGGDPTDALGTCCGLRCHIAPHAWQLGWSEPLAQLDAGGLPAGLWRRFSLPAMATSDANMIRISLDWISTQYGTPSSIGAASRAQTSAIELRGDPRDSLTSPPPPPARITAKQAKAAAAAAAAAAVGRPEPPALFISFRTPTGYDIGLDLQSTYKVQVHLFNGTRYGTNGARPQLLARLGASEVFGAPPPPFLPARHAGPPLPDLGGLVLVVRDVGRAGADVALCRPLLLPAEDAGEGEGEGREMVPQSVELNCEDNLDDDCDGLIDAEDPDCGAGVAVLPDPAICNRNGRCEAARGERASTCPQDCPAACGDGLCERDRGESAQGCPQDCRPQCGDGFCDAGRGEDFASCSADCPEDVCGDGVCGSTEDPVTCAADCCAAAAAAARCGDGVCDAFAGESCSSCPADCAGTVADSAKPPPKRGRKQAAGEAASRGGAGAGAGAGVGFCCGADAAELLKLGLGAEAGGCEDARCRRGGLRCRTTCVV
ncbi:hypothetical protein HYH03_015314 [Edaphochlamys debaryana]|uniref:Peptidase M11 gametolysin domain-containing protein n=1 Tax=Edaphochlamys debaryana TaxID=47281 RepID=A0A835XME2_9CHLO|nr:hypothetical protein HYH03_015314 [Edaphochlamys debaryana]|eukprot:KAG2485992.1 hypothetical protein HYH03_015314 [Edaphochlamys debaryana]